MEGHPEENHNGKHEAQGNNTLLGLFLAQFLDGHIGSLVLLLASSLGMAEGRAEDVIDGD